MKKFVSHFELPISEANQPLIPILAKEFGWIPGMDITPEEMIEKYFQEFYDRTRQRVELGLIRLKGEANVEEVNAIMEQYNNAVICTSSFEEYED